MSTLLQAQGLIALRGERLLFRDIDIAVAPGDAVLLRGANGTGKTTLLRILAGLTQPEAGAVTRPVAAHWTGHRGGLKPHETPRGHLSLWARAWGADRQAIPAILETSGLSRPADLPARLLSAGQCRRTALARLMLQSRPLWLMDEPFSALDSQARRELETRIEAHRTAGGGVVMALHGETRLGATRVLNL